MTIDPQTGLPEGWHRLKYQRNDGRYYFEIKTGGSKARRIRSQRSLNSYLEDQGIMKHSLTLKGPVALKKGSEEGKQEEEVSTTNSRWERSTFEQELLMEIPPSEGTGAQKGDIILKRKAPEENKEDNIKIIKTEMED